MSFRTSTHLAGSLSGGRRSYREYPLLQTLQRLHQHLAAARFGLRRVLGTQLGASANDRFHIRLLSSEITQPSAAIAHGALLRAAAAVSG
jgi:hypothetical protein